jgi:hypothetical protein
VAANKESEMDSKREWTLVVVTLHTPAGDVRSVFRRGDLELVRSCVADYLGNGKSFTVAYE